MDGVKDEDLLEEVAKRLDLCASAEAEFRSNALEALRFLAGDQWPENVRSQRAKDGRPCLTVNTLPTYLHQVTNDLRQNKTSIKIHPVDGEADPKTAVVIQGVIRHIEYESWADVAYDTGGSHAAGIGRGFFRLVTEYESHDSFNQVIRFKRVRNPLSVYFDPFSMQPDGSDARFAFISEDQSRDEFKMMYPKAKACGQEDTRGIGDYFNGWLDADTVRVVEYYCKKEKKQVASLMPDGTVTIGDSKADGAVKTRDTMVPAVYWYKVTALDILEKTEIPCEWIPVFPVDGQEIDINGRVIRKGLIHDAIDPARMYNVWMTAATEEVAMRPKTPWVMAEGQADGHESKWKTANVANHAFMEYKPVAIGGQLAPPPQRQPMADIPSGVLAMAMHARDNIKATTGLFDSSMGASGTATSGKQEIAQQRQGQVGNFHFADNLARAVRHAGRCILSMIPKIYDTPRVVRMLGDDEEPSFAKVNEEVTEKNPKTLAIETVMHDLTVGRYDVTVSTGPSYSTVRQEAAQSLTELAGSWPELRMAAGDKVIKALNWPDGDEIADRMKKMMPPGMVPPEPDEQAGPQVPPEVQQMLQQYEAALEDAMGKLQEANDQSRLEIQKAQINAGATVEVAKIKAMADIEAKREMNAAQAQQSQQAQQAAHTNAEPQEDKSNEALAMVANAMLVQAQAMSAPRRKVMRIQAPSGGVYEGEVIEAPIEEDEVLTGPLVAEE